MIVYLIGMPGCGKSKTARYLQIEKNYNVVDLDRYIENKEGMEINDIMNKYGLNYFRKIETNALKEMGATYKDIIVSCGGGIITIPENKEIMKNGLTIFLNAGLFVGVIGTALGTIIGVIATYFVANNFLQGYFKVSVCIDNTNLLIIALSSISMSLLFTLYPAIKASKCDAISNLGRG